MMLTPKTGSVVARMGNSAQWMAQSTEVLMPTASQFIFTFIQGQKYENAILLQKISCLT